MLIVLQPSFWVAGWAMLPGIEGGALGGGGDEQLGPHTASLSDQTIMWDRTLSCLRSDAYTAAAAAALLLISAAGTTHCVCLVTRPSSCTLSLQAVQALETHQMGKAANFGR